MLWIGSVVERMPGPKYAAQLDFAELHLREPLPRVATLRRQRAEAPGDLGLALRAPARAVSSARGPLRFDAELEQGLEWLLGACDALRATAVVLPTPIELTPGQRSRDLLAAYRERLPRTSDTHFVWAPRGPWEPADRYQLAQSLGLGCAYDPFEEPAPQAGVAYARLQAMGARRSFTESTLADLLSILDAGTDTPTFVAIDSPRAFDEAVRLQRLAEGVGEDQDEDQDEQA